MILLFCLLLTTTAHKVIDSNEDIPPESFNTTTLYPVKVNSTEDTTKQNTATSWKIETTFADSEEKDKNAAVKANTSIEKESAVKQELKKPDNDTSKEFKPSPHIGNFFDEDNFALTPTRETFDSYSTVIKKPPTGIIRSHKQKSPNEVLKNYQQFPYKFEKSIFTRAKDKENWQSTGLPNFGQMESRPTAEVPVRVPAGGLYKFPDAFKEKPGTSGDDEDFGLEFSGGEIKENGLKKQSNPWKNVMHLITALIPIGIIISALTPSVITLESTDNLHPSQHILRRMGAGVSHTNAGVPHTDAGVPHTDAGVPHTDAGVPHTSLSTPHTVAGLPSISERCRRRLLCELHSDKNYPSRSRRVKHCHKIYCEDAEAMTKTLQWLLAHHQPFADHGRF